jgi:nitrite reductase (NADH) small subunit
MSSTKTTERHVIVALDELPPGEKKIVSIKGRSIGVINDNGNLYAVRNVCPHHGAPLCEGRVQGWMRPSAPHTYDYSDNDVGDRVLLCPWHGYKFRLVDGRSPIEPDRLGVRTYRVEVEDGDVVLYL